MSDLLPTPIRGTTTPEERIPRHKYFLPFRSLIAESDVVADREHFLRPSFAGTNIGLPIGCSVVLPPVSGI